MFKFWTLIALVFCSSSALAQHAYVLEIYELEVVHGAQKMHPDTIYKYVLEEGEESTFVLFEDQYFTYQVDFKAKQNRAKVKLKRNGRLKVAEDNFKGKSFEDVKFVSEESDWKISGSGNELIVYDKKELNSVFLSYRFKLKPKNTLGFR